MEYFSNIKESDIITRYFVQETSAEENNMLQKWLEISQENIDYFNQLKQVWENETDHTALDQKFRTSESWDKVKSIVNKQQHIHGRSVYFMRISIAATILLLLGFGFYFVSHNNKETRIASNKRILKITMPDNTVIWLNRSSEIIYKNNYAKKRSVKFSGEGYFEVKPDAANQFEIRTNNAKITVLGTRFNVKANPKDSVTEVVVRSGRVVLSKVSAANKQENEILLGSGEKGSTHTSENAPQKKPADDPNYLSWKTHEFTFSNTNIKEIVTIINEIYDTNVVLAEGNTENCNLSGQYSCQSIDDILDMLRIVLNIEVEKDAEKIVIKTGGC